MSTETNPNAAATNAAPPAQSQPTPSAQPPVVDPNKEPDHDPPWLAKRLEQAKRVGAKDVEANARKALLEELGGDPDSIKKLLAEEKKRAEERKTLEQRVAERDAELKGKDDRNRELEESVKSYAEGQLAGLTEQQKAAVIAVAGNDPPKQLKAIEALRPTWAIVAPSHASTASVDTTANGSPNQTPTVSTSAKPANATAPPPNAPPPAGMTVVQNHLETYEQLLKNQPFVASDYYRAHYAEINEARSKRSN